MIVRRAQNLGVLDAPAHVGTVGPVGGGHGTERLLVPLRYRSIAAIADGMGGDLYAAAQRRLVQGDDLLAGDLHQTGGVGTVGIGFEQRRAARAEGPVGIVFDRPGDDAAVGDAARAARDQGSGAVRGDAVVDAQGCLARFGHGLQQGNVPPRRAHEMDPGPAIGGLDAEAGAIGITQGFRISLRHQPGDQLFGRVHQQTGRPAVRALEDFPARWGHGRHVNARRGEGGGGGGHSVAVGPAQQDDPPRRGHVQISGGQEAGFRPTGLDPAPSDNGALRMSLGPGGQSRHSIGDRGRALEVQRQFAPADAIEVGVAVGEAGEQGRTLEVDVLVGRRLL